MRVMTSLASSRISTAPPGMTARSATFVIIKKQCQRLVVQRQYLYPCDTWSSLRTAKYTWVEDWSKVGYPGLLKNCEQCHVSGTYDFTATASSVRFPISCITPLEPAPRSAAGAKRRRISRKQQAWCTVAASATLLPRARRHDRSGVHDAGQLADQRGMLSCHDSAAQGPLWCTTAVALRSSLNRARQAETCLVCHGPANNALFNETAPAIKTVHRWW